jgi:flagellar basal-body rod protein FlgF
MDRMIYVGMAGAKMNMQRQDVLSNNLANVSTGGFRAELQATRAVPVQGDGASTRVYSLETTVGYDDSAGPVSAKTANGQQTAVGKLKLVSPTDKLVRGEDGLFRSADGNELDADPAARVQDGALEGSNVNPIETMVAMIAAARQFETQMKLMQTAETDERQAAQLLSGSGG